MMLDEVQCGMGRTGRLFAHEWAGVTPDIMMVAKGIGGGFPLGAVLATEDAASGMTAGTHGSTYGGNPLACAVGCAVMDVDHRPGLSRRGQPQASGRLRQGLEGLVAAHPSVFKRVRGRGLMLGIECAAPVADVVRAGYDAHVIVVPAAENVVRLLPPLNLTDAEIDEGLRRLDAAATALEAACMRSFLDMHTTPAGDLRAILDDAHALKAARSGATLGAPDAEQPLAGRIVALVFEKPSTRTRVSFDVGVRQMGGETLVLSGAEMQLGHGETIADTARVLSRYVDMIMIRTFEAQTLHEMAEHATVPVINGLTNRQPSLPDHGRHDDLRGAPEARSPGSKVVWTGDGNNTCTSFLHAAGQFGFDFTFTGPEALDPAPEAVAFARGKGSRVDIERDAERAVEGADLVVTDTWVSMHDAPSDPRAPLQPAAPLPGQRAADGARQARRAVHALPARPPRAKRSPTR